MGRVGLSNGWCYWRSLETYPYGDSGEEKGSEVESNHFNVLCEPVQVCTISNALSLSSTVSFAWFVSIVARGFSLPSQFLFLICLYDFFCSALCLFIPWIFLEKPKIQSIMNWRFDAVIMALNSLCMFSLNMLAFLVISHTSALTIRVAGVVKDWVVVLLSTLLFADTKLTTINLFGYGVGMLLIL